MVVFLASSMVVCVAWLTLCCALIPKEIGVEGEWSDTGFRWEWGSYRANGVFIDGALENFIMQKLPE